MSRLIHSLLPVMTSAVKALLMVTPSATFVSTEHLVCMGFELVKANRNSAAASEVIWILSFVFLCNTVKLTWPTCFSAVFCRYPDKGFDDNYCRNPDGKPRPWCFTLDPNTRWEFCNIKTCGELNTSICYVLLLLLNPVATKALFTCSNNG